MFHSARPRQAQQRIDHDLAGTVIGHLAAAVAVDDGDVAGVEHVLRQAGLAQGVHRRVLAQPDLVRRIGAALVGVRLHFLPDRQIVRRPREPLDHGDPAYRTMDTIGWPCSAW
ncbi:hypothetical protein G6F46_014749 [Rhizopus delemar]|nr:hypothetical protein G6F46_014749 [Rhizopus delemar]